MKLASQLTFLSSIILFTGLWAESSLPIEPESKEHQERVLRRTSTEHAEIKQLLKQQRAAEKQAEEEIPLSTAPTKKEVTTSEFRFASRQELPKYLLTSACGYYLPDYTHWLSNIGPNGHLIDMEDGTRWEIASGDIYRLNSWRLNDPIVVTPNYSWFSSGDFYITNQNTNTSVRADLVVSPIAFGPYSHWIIGIDHNAGRVYLENGTSWTMSSGDYFVYRTWEVNDHIIIGYNDSFLSAYDRILINFNMDSYVRAKQY